MKKILIIIGSILAIAIIAAVGFNILKGQKIGKEVENLEKILSTSESVTYGSIERKGTTIHINQFSIDTGDRVDFDKVIIKNISLNNKADIEFTNMDFNRGRDSIATKSGYFKGFDFSKLDSAERNNINSVISNAEVEEFVLKDTTFEDMDATIETITYKGDKENLKLNMKNMKIYVGEPGMEYLVMKNLDYVMKNNLKKKSSHNKLNTTWDGFDFDMEFLLNNYDEDYIKETNDLTTLEIGNFEFVYKDKGILKDTISKMFSAIYDFDVHNDYLLALNDEDYDDYDDYDDDENYVDYDYDEYYEDEYDDYDEYYDDYDDYYDEDYDYYDDYDDDDDYDYYSDDYDYYNDYYYADSYSSIAQDLFSTLANSISNLDELTMEFMQFIGKPEKLIVKINPKKPVPFNNILNGDFSDVNASVQVNSNKPVKIKFY